MRPVIICVDDEETVLSTLKKQLKNNLQDKIAVEVAESGEEAMELVDELILANTEIPVFISDQIMPGLKGDELLAKIHIKLPATLKILLTGQASVQDLGMAVNRSNLYRYIGKPWEETDLILTVTEAIRSYDQAKMIQSKTRELESLNLELKRQVDTFYKFVPIQFLEILNTRTSLDQICLGMCTECHLTVLFSDIRSFTQLSEKMTPQATFRFLNSYLDRMVPIIRKNGGFVDKFIGDSIMGLFKNASQALDAAIEMLFFLRDYNKGRGKAGYPPIQIGIGMNTGNVSLGTIGENNRIETTVIGDAVNVASRIEYLTKIYTSPLLICETTYNEIEAPDRFHIRFIGRLKFKGKETEAGVYEVYDLDEENVMAGKVACARIFGEAIEYYHNKQYEMALEAFESCFASNTGDLVAKNYIRLCKELISASSCAPKGG